MNRPSKRFTPTRFSQRLVPLILALIVLGLAATLIVTVLAALGLTPSF